MAFLAPGGAQVHHHSVFHFIGPDAVFEAICKKVLGMGFDGGLRGAGIQHDRK